MQEEETTEKIEYIIEPTIINETTQSKKNFFHRTFSKMEKGGLRGNIFLMIITTTGCAFFYLPYQSKKTGIILTPLLLLFPCAVSYYSSSLLYLGFKTTKAKTFDECMNKILGKKLGFISNIMIFIHTFGAVVSVWLFSYEFLITAVKQIFSIEKSEEKGFEEICFYSYCGVIMCFLYISSILGKVETLKKISMVGILIIIYTIIVFGSLMPEYFEAYKSEIKIVAYRFDINTFKTVGICFYLFLNQYTVLPICNNLKRVCSKRITKVVKRTNGYSLLLYLLLTFIGYFSMPNDPGREYELFLKRPALEGRTDTFVLIAQILFGFNLIIAVLVKGHFFTLYFHQLISNFKYFLKKKKKNSIILNGKSENLIISKISDQKSERRRRRKTGSNLSINDNKLYNTFVSEQSDGFQFKTNEENKLNKDEKSVSRKSFYSDGEEPDYNFNLKTEVILPEDTIEEGRRIKKNKKHYILNFFFILITTIITILIRNVLHRFVSLVGSFVGIFEIVIFPFSMILVLNSQNQIMSRLQMVLLIIVSLIFIILGICSFITTLIYPD